MSKEELGLLSGYRCTGEGDGGEGGRGVVEDDSQEQHRSERMMKSSQTLAFAKERAFDIFIIVSLDQSVQIHITGFIYFFNA